MSYTVYARVSTGAGDYALAFDAGNYTSNCAAMWAAAISGTFDKPQTRLAHLDGRLCSEATPILERAMLHMWDPANLAQYEAMNPSNNWGNFATARKYLLAITEGCRKHPLAELRVIGS